MPQAIAGIFVGGLLVFCLFFFEPWLLDYAIHWVNTPYRAVSGRGAIGVFVEQPFTVAEGGDDTAWYVDQQTNEVEPSLGCEAVFAVQNRTDRPLNVAMAVHYRGQPAADDAFDMENGPDPVALAPGATIEQAVRAGSLTPDACMALNRRGTLVVEAEACPGEEGTDVACEDTILDPADIVMRAPPAPVGPPIPGAAPYPYSGGPAPYPYSRTSAPYPYSRT